jgi:hypothetical protein
MGYNFASREVMDAKEEINKFLDYYRFTEAKAYVEDDASQLQLDDYIADYVCDIEDYYDYNYDIRTPLEEYYYIHKTILRSLPYIEEAMEKTDGFLQEPVYVEYNYRYDTTSIVYGISIAYGKLEVVIKDNRYNDGKAIRLQAQYDTPVFHG